MAIHFHSVVDCTTGIITQVQFTAAEETQLTNDQTAAATAAAAQAVLDGNAATLTSRATTALTANTTFLAVTAPSNVQVAAQVALLTQECSALIRLLLHQLDSTA